jgi:hypothetical protein
MIPPAFAFDKMEAIARKKENGEAMTPRVVLDHIVAEPFRPFRIHTASGRTFEIRQPEFVEIGRSTLTVYAPPEGDPNGPQRWEKISLVLIESIAPLDTPITSDGQ